MQKQKPFDLQLILGHDNTGKEIGQLNVDFQLKPERVLIILSKIKALVDKLKMKQDLAEDIIIKFDFSTQEGREKECIQYFENGLDFDDKDCYDYDLSPLQNWFKRPKKSGKLDLFQSPSIKENQGRVTLEYRLYNQILKKDGDGQNIFQLVQNLQKSTFHPDLNLNAKFYGDVETSKKNRIKLKLDYINFHLTSNEFKMKDFQNLLLLLQIFGEGEDAIEEVKGNPLFKFFENTEQIQAKINFSSIRNMVKLYECGVGEDNTIKERKKQHPDILKGLFKEDLRVTMIIASKFAFTARYKYRNESALIRMLTGFKKYMRYFD